MLSPKITLIGGGTGSYTLLQSLKTLSPNITALVNMADDGGSTGVLRDELGVLPPGDIRQCLVALSDAPQELRDLFNFRFPSGTLEGHSFGNIFLSAVEKMTNNFDDSVRMASDILRITGRVLPITVDNCELVMSYDDKSVYGQRAVELTNLKPKIFPKITFSHNVKSTLAARQAILEADIVVIAPGNLYASLAPALIVDGISSALVATKAKVVYVCNLINKPNHTTDFAVHDYAHEIERFTATGVLDYVLYNLDTPTESLLKKYALEREFPVKVVKGKLDDQTYNSIGGNYLSHSHMTRNPHDTLIKRSLIRHDAAAVVETIKGLCSL